MFRTERLPPKALFFARAVSRQYPNLDDPQSVLRMGVIDKRGDSLKKNIGKTSHVLCFPFCTKHTSNDIHNNLNKWGAGGDNPSQSNIGGIFSDFRNTERCFNK